MKQEENQKIKSGYDRFDGGSRLESLTIESLNFMHHKN